MRLGLLLLLLTSLPAWAGRAELPAGIEPYLRATCEAGRIGGLVDPTAGRLPRTSHPATVPPARFMVQVVVVDGLTRVDGRPAADRAALEVVLERSWTAHEQLMQAIAPDEPMIVALFVDRDTPLASVGMLLAALRPYVGSGAQLVVAQQATSASLPPPPDPALPGRYERARRALDEQMEPGPAYLTALAGLRPALALPDGACPGLLAETSVPLRASPSCDQSVKTVLRVLGTCDLSEAQARSAATAIGLGWLPPGAEPLHFVPLTLGSGPVVATTWGQAVTSGAAVALSVP